MPGDPRPGLEFDRQYQQRMPGHFLDKSIIPQANTLKRLGSHELFYLQQFQEGIAREEIEGLVRARLPARFGV